MTEATPEQGDRSLASQRSVETIALGVILAFSALMAWDNWRTGIRWESTGPQAGYFPFYVSIILAGACIYGLAREAVRMSTPSRSFVSRDEFRRVMQVFVPTLAFVPATQWLGLYVASFVLISGFMYGIGKLKPWVSLVTGFVFSLAMFVVFEIAFDVIMPKGPLERLFGY